MKGYGDIVRIDLTNGSIRRDPVSPELAKKFVGGMGLNDWFLWQHFLEIEPHIDPMSEDNVLIAGLGPVGLGAVALSKFLGAEVVAVDMEGWRRERALSLGAEFALDPADTDVLAFIREHTRGDGVPRALDASGNPQAVGPFTVSSSCPSCSGSSGALRPFAPPSGSPSGRRAGPCWIRTIPGRPFCLILRERWLSLGSFWP